MKCSIQSCDRESRSGGMCNRHYESKRRTGRAETGKRITPYGMPAVRTDGYVRLRVDGARQLAHVVVAETAIGRSLPAGAVVHHVDRNRSNNDPMNLVICPSTAYHRLIHQRMDAMDACGNPNWRKCTHCKQYDDPINLRIDSGNKVTHPECERAYRRSRHQAKAMAT